MTPYELNLRILEHAKIKESETKNGIFLAYMTAYLHRVEKMPPLKKLIGENKPKTKQMTDEQLLAQVRALNAQFGGKEVIVNKVEE